jgi:hypothetical protein
VTLFIPFVGVRFAAGIAAGLSSRVPDEGGRCYTTEIQNTHKTAFREITYRWHPWHGQRVLVRGEARRGGVVVLQCVCDELKGFPTLEIPEWMFDSHLCGQMKPAELPRVDCAALLALKHLKASAISSDGIQ